ncbi:hypothetical protein PISMIDRAFT_19633 [Pisolithus microcarpus 441]|uniref:Unplaced genomic scaffold scaffold_564, whole genome shotgun sequence n=1 Tax=Pisolithus microcarpus 441 TaxID=765257 RepID=A0A0C9YTU1_9AGAM|nr:hypothetical protein PISMIDRAFT_19633 [Pisolithus microcarpus 441]
MSTGASSAYGILEDAVQEIITNLKEVNHETMAALDNTSQEQKFQDACSLMYSLEKDLSPKNLAHLQMLFEEKPSFTMGYKAISGQLELVRKWWVKGRLEGISCSVLEYAYPEGQ